MKYYSELLKKVYDTPKELEKAEAEYNKKHEAELIKAEEKKKAAKAVEEAYLNYVKVTQECSDKINNAKQDWVKLRNEFASKYGGYHMTYTSSDKDGNVFNLFNDFFDTLFKF